MLFLWSGGNIRICSSLKLSTCMMSAAWAGRGERGEGGGGGAGRGERGEGGGGAGRGESLVHTCITGISDK